MKELLSTKWHLNNSDNLKWQWVDHESMLAHHIGLGFNVHLKPFNYFIGSNGGCSN